MQGLYWSKFIHRSLRVTGSRLVVLRRVVFSFPLLAALLVLGAGGCFHSACAQETSSFTKAGYITAVRPPNGFDVNGEQVETRPDTIFKLMDDQPGIADGQLRDAVRVGAYVRVLEKFDAGSKTATAVSVLFRDDWDKKLSGFGVIDKVIVTGAEPVFQADGYRIRIAQGTELSYWRRPEDSCRCRDQHLGPVQRQTRPEWGIGGCAGQIRYLQN
jgi:hypothetical protein